MLLKVLIVLFSVSAFAESDVDSDPRRLFSSKDLESPLDFLDDLNYRLPNNTRPIKYNLWITTDIHRDEREFLGKVEIQIEALEDSKDITLHYRQITITNVDLFNASDSLIESNVAISFREDVEFLIIKPSENLVKGEIYWLDISYEGQLRDDNMGFYRSTFVDRNGNIVPYAATKFEPHNARHAFPW
jgi:aminopeptidase N